MTKEKEKLSLAEVKAEVDRVTKATFSFIRTLAFLTLEDMKITGHKDYEDVIMSIRHQFIGLNKQIEEIDKRAVE